MLTRPVPAELTSASAREAFSAAPYASDADVVDGVRRRDAAAEREFYRRFATRVRRYLRAQTGCDTIADDRTQDTFITAFACIHDFRGDASVASWLLGIARHRVIDGHRAEWRHERWRITGDQAIEVECHDAPRDPYLAARLMGCLGALPARFRDVLLLHDVHGCTHRQISSVLHIAVGTSKANLHRARRIVRQQLMHRSADPRLPA
ncbi:MAG: RNA polymerase sigma factor [Gemmatimonadota bacterium]